MLKVFLVDVEKLELLELQVQQAVEPVKSTRILPMTAQRRKPLLTVKENLVSRYYSLYIVQVHTP